MTELLIAIGIVIAAFLVGFVIGRLREPKTKVINEALPHITSMKKDGKYYYLIPEKEFENIEPLLGKATQAQHALASAEEARRALGLGTLEFAGDTLETAISNLESGLSDSHTINDIRTVANKVRKCAQALEGASRS